MEAGKVYFIGAGPGAEDLLTLRGAALLEEADVVVYAGSLVNAALLKRCKPEVEIHDSARLDLNEVLDILIPAARAGKRVVRLHTGDPSVYGAHREQMDALEAAAVPFEVCPGVSSFFGAAASLGAEYTLPGVSQTVILTRAAGRTPMPEKESLSALAAHGASMVLFLSAGRVAEAVSELLAGGYYTNETPAAVVYKATWPDERILRSMLGELAKDAEAAGITKTALLLIGDFLGAAYENSKLYDPSFTTEFREGKQA